MNIEYKRTQVKDDIIDTCMMDHESLRYYIQEYVNLLSDENIEKLFEEFFSEDLE